MDRSVFYECNSCHEILKAQEGDCCVFCSYGDVACPSVQRTKTNSLAHHTAPPTVQRSFDQLNYDLYANVAIIASNGLLQSILISFLRCHCVVRQVATFHLGRHRRQ
jgi:hypothetical protein